MLRKTRKHRKKLAKLVLATLLFTGGAYGLMSPPVAEAADSLTVTGYSSESGFVPVSDALINIGYYYVPKDDNVVELNLAQGTWDNPGYVAGHVGTDANGANGITVNMTGANVVVSGLYGGIAAGDGALVGELDHDAAFGAADCGPQLHVHGAAGAFAVGMVQPEGRPARGFGGIRVGVVVHCMVPFWVWLLLGVEQACACEIAFLLDIQLAQERRFFDIARLYLVVPGQIGDGARHF